jgi:outer membrane immunogenic protein
MLRKVLLASIAAATIVPVAFAADLPAHAPPPPPPPPLYSWTGVYAGVNAGGHWSNSTTDLGATDSSTPDVGAGLGAAQANGVIPFSAAANASGFIGGGQIGYNYQLNNLVLGVEADFDGTTGRTSSDALLSNAIFPLPTDTQTAQRLDWLGTLRGRFGWTPIDRLLIYATGGLAFGQSTASLSVINTAGLPPIASYVQAKRNTGWTVGGGLEYALPDAWSNWSVKVEYLYYDLGYSNSTIYYSTTDITGTPEFSSLNGRIRHNGNIVRAGLNYKFNFGSPAPVVAKY